jgi:hypothetical protein
MPRTKPRTPPSPNPTLERKRRLQALRTKLEAERTSWSRWMTRLKRAFHSMEKSLQRITRLEREIARISNP